MKITLEIDDKDLQKLSKHLHKTVAKVKDKDLALLLYQMGKMLEDRGTNPPRAPRKRKSTRVN